ncbi:adenylate cyclase type 10 [Haematococcus lacustris]|uniref:Adenylate cyclase type 10 n=1 Tax=Haematococcus lacustris TaxID=44745 RepID=A0A6A0AGR3_HAELA|nr:adenylate cyclase type 10 [Haematococcus lacustris]
MVDGAAGHTSFSAVGSAYKGQLHWNLISRITRAQWEKSMASCCLGIVMQHRLEYNQMEIWDTEDYFTLLTEHAIRGLMLLGAPHPRMVLASQTTPPWWAKLVPCLAPNTEDELAGWQAGVVLQDQEVTEIRDILLVLIIAAEHYSQQQDASEYTRLLTFCKRICKPPADGLDFGVAGPILGQRESASLGQEAAQQVVPGPELSRAVLGMRRFPGPLQRL